MEEISSVFWLSLGILLLAGIALWVIVPLATGLPWVPSRDKRIRRALQLAGVQKGETVYDLGAGDGRVLVTAAREFGARGVGIEVSPMHCLVAVLHILVTGTSRQVKIQCASMYDHPLPDAGVVFVYATPEHAARLRPHLERELKSGARVVTLSAEIAGWQPDRIDRDDLIFLYKMPPTPGSLESYLSKDL
jgi:hypothetical protein